MLSKSLAVLMLFSLGVAARGQFVDNGAADKVPAAAAEDAAADSGESASFSRQLLQLRDQRSANAVRFGPDSPMVATLDARIAALREQIAAAHLPSASAPPAISNDSPPIAPNFPRIVQNVAQEPPSAATVTTDVIASTGVRAAPYSGDSPANQTARATFAQANVTIVADALALSKCIDSLHDQSHCNININWKALEAAGIDRQTPVTATLNNLSAAQALTLVLGNAGGGTGNLGFTFDDGVVMVSTRDDLCSEKYQTVRMYNIADLLQMPAGMAYVPQMPGDYLAQRAASITSTITGIIAPDSWRDNGGTLGSIREFDDVLIINQTNDNHRLIEQFLAQFRAVRAQQN